MATKAVWCIQNVPDQETFLRKAILKEPISLKLQLQGSVNITNSIQVVIDTVRPESGDGSSGHWLFTTKAGHDGYVHTYGKRGHINL